MCSVNVYDVVALEYELRNRAFQTFVRGFRLLILTTAAHDYFDTIISTLRPAVCLPRKLVACFILILAHSSRSSEVTDEICIALNKRSALRTTYLLLNRLTRSCN